MTTSSEQSLHAKAFLNQCFPKGRIDRVLLVNPPDGTDALFRLPTAKRRRYPNYPPYGLGVLAQHLRKIGKDVHILNLNHEILAATNAFTDDGVFPFDAIWQCALDEAIARFTPDLIGVTCMFTMTHTSLKKVCEHAATSNLPIAIGGVHVTNDAERILNDIPCVQFAFLRESDLAITAFCQAIADKKSVNDLGQIIFNTPQSRLHFDQDMRPSAAEMDVIPSFDLMHMEDLTRHGVIGNFHGFKSPDTRFATVLSNRGCRGSCTFCSVRNFNGATVRQRSVPSVLDELEILEHEYGIGHFVWLDDDLLKDERRAFDLFNGMASRNLTMTWDATNGVIAASCTKDMVQAMAESGCIAVSIGMESGNPDILRQIRKPGTVRNFLSAAEAFRAAPQIHARVFLMIGFPDETLSMIGDTISIAQDIDLDWCGTTVLQPLPNTPIYTSMVEQGLIPDLGSTETRFNAGGYGKQDEIDLGLRAASQDFAEAFAAIPLDAVPTPTQLNDIWFFMNYHLNFHRLFSEDRPIKLQQQLLNLTALSDVISPEHCLALYFTGVIQHRLSGHIAPDIITRLRTHLALSPYWADRMQAFGLTIADLETTNFRNKHIPRLKPGQILT
ncbi:MAG: radical SAM protein [Rhodospirillaceae bacterium]|nr:radical SAM protein [Rhodospirillaceae bacterium]